MRALTVDWLTLRRSAARLKLAVSATSRKVRMCSMFIGRLQIGFFDRQRQ